MIEVPKEILWDYIEAPDDLQWRLPRLADFFPLYGRDRGIIELLYAYRERLKIDEGTRALIEAYYSALKRKEGP